MLLLTTPVTSIDFPHLYVYKVVFDNYSTSAELYFDCFKGTRGQPDYLSLGTYLLNIKNGKCSKLVNDGRMFDISVQEEAIDVPFGFNSLVFALQSAGAQTSNAAIAEGLDKGWIDSSFAGTFSVD